MPIVLPQLNHRMLPVTDLGGGNGIEDVLVAIKGALDGTQYYDGLSRTPGSGSAWTAEVEEDGGTVVAVRLYPPGAAVDEMAGILAGHASTAYTPTMHANHSWLTNTLHGASSYGIANVAAQNAFTDANPWNGDVFSGFAGVFNFANTAARFHIIETQETLWIGIVDNTINGAVYPYVVGALVQASNPAWARPNGRVYLLHTAGGASNNNGLVTNFHNASLSASTNDAYLLANLDNLSTNRTFCCVNNLDGDGWIRARQYMLSLNQGIGASAFRQGSYQYLPRIEIEQGGLYRGFVREIHRLKDDLHGRPMRSPDVLPGSDKAYLFGARQNSTAACVGLMY